MDKHSDQMMGLARSIGTIRNIIMGDADKWNPKHFHISGVTDTGEKFALVLEIGEKKEAADGTEILL